jgi:hypothetical protein
VLGTLLVAALLRYREALRTPFNFEEIYVLFLARKGFHGMLATLAQDVEQPLHFIVTWAWRGLGGEGALWLKTVPMLCGLLLILVMFPLGRAMFGRWAGFFAALALAFEATHVHFSQQAYYNSLLWLLDALALWFAWRWFERRRPADGMLYVIAGAAALYTYYFAFFPLVTLAIVIAWWLRRDRRALGTWLALNAAVLVLFAPQIPLVVAQLHRDVVGDRLVPPMAFEGLIDLVRKLTSMKPIVMAPIVVLALLPLIRREQRRPAVLLWLLMVVPTIGPWLLSRAGIHLFYMRQMLYTLPIWYLLVGAGIAGIRIVPLRVAVAVGTLGLLLRAYWLSAPFDEAVQLEAGARYVAERVQPGDLVLFTEPHALLFFQYHLPDRARYRLLSMPGVEKFHYSDGILAVPDSVRATPAEWEAERRRGTRWWGVRVTHFPIYRTGAEAAAALTEAARSSAQPVPEWTHGKVTVWSGQPGSRALSGGERAGTGVASAKARIP